MFASLLSPISTRHAARHAALHATGLEASHAAANPAVALSTAPLLRPVRAADAQAMRDFVQALSPAARRCRFHGTLKACSDALARQLTVVDGACHVACVATVTDEDGVTRIVGEARYVVGDDDAQRAEFAIAVADDWQGSGLAARLMTALIELACAAGLQALHGEVLADNQRMLGFVQRMGFDGGVAIGHGVLRVERAIEVRQRHARDVRRARPAHTSRTIGSSDAGHVSAPRWLSWLAAGWLH